MVLNENQDLKKRKKKMSKPNRPGNNRSVLEEITLESLKDELAEAMAMLEELDGPSKNDIPVALAPKEHLDDENIDIQKLRAKSTASSLISATLERKNPRQLRKERVRKQQTNGAAKATVKAKGTGGRLQKAVHYGRVLAGDQDV